MTAFQIQFSPMGLRRQASAGQSLLDTAQQAGVELISLCGGRGTCKRCRITITAGQIQASGAKEDGVSARDRLACQTYPQSDLKVQIPTTSLRSPLRLQLDGDVPAPPLDPVVKCYGIPVKRLKLDNGCGDIEPLLRKLRQLHGVHAQLSDPAVRTSLSMHLKRAPSEAEIVTDGDNIIDLIPKGDPCLGAAVDLGTTKIALYLIDLRNGRPLTSGGCINPQIAQGEDLISRLAYANKTPQQAGLLQQVIVDALNRMIMEICQSHGIVPQAIKEMVVAGNTAMHHLFLGLPVVQLSQAPYATTIRKAMKIKAREIGVTMATGAQIYFPANVAGYVGGDHVAMLTGIGAHRIRGPLLAIDIGTNTEISLMADGKISSVSCASGPAFEGFHIKNGMQAATGAIEQVRLVDGNASVKIIDATRPAGICGSGLLDLLAQLRLNAIVDRSGRLNLTHPRIRHRDAVPEFVLFQEDRNGSDTAIVLTQKDIRELQLAKGAIRSGIEMLLAYRNIPANLLDQVIVAGAFGSYLDISSAISIGMFPNVARHRFCQVGNAAGMGAKMVLLSRLRRFEAEEMAQQMDYLELASSSHFGRTFIRSLELDALNTYT